MAASRDLAVNRDDVRVTVAQAIDPGQTAGFEQFRVQCGEHVAQLTVAGDAAVVGVEASEERQMLGSPQRRLHEVIRPGDRRSQNQQQDFRQWIQHLGVLTRIGQDGEMSQQRDADRRSHGRASIDEAPYESNFQPRRKLPSIQAIGLPAGIGALSQCRRLATSSKQH